jgi:myosin heavy subunit
MDQSVEYQFNGYDSLNQERTTSYNETNSHDMEYESQDDQHEDEEVVEEEKPSSGGVGKIVAIVILALLLIGSGGYNYFQFTETETRIEEQKIAEKQRLEASNAVKAQIEKQLEETKATISQYQSETANAQSLLDAANIEIEKKQRKIARLVREKASLNEFQAQLQEAKTLDETLLAQIKTLSDELTLVKAENSALKDSLATLQVDRKAMNEKIIAASGLQAHTIKMESMSKQKKEKYEFTDRAKHTNRLAISFELAENKLAAAGVHNLHVIVYTPTGEILGDNSNKFTIQPEGKESTYTRNKEVNYPSEGGKIFFNWDETPKYAPGAYRVEVYCDGKLTGQSEITLK